MCVPSEPGPGKSDNSDDEDNGDDGDNHLNLGAGLSGEVAV